MTDLRLKGILKKWLDDKGYGFLAFDKGKQIIFIHISAFGEGLARRPKVGDTVSFYIQLENDGKRKAVDAIIQGVGPARETSGSGRGKPKAVRKSKSSKLMFLPMLVVLGVMVGFVVYYKFFE
jgi:cold shock CspA family protein